MQHVNQSPSCPDRLLRYRPVRRSTGGEYEPPSAEESVRCKVSARSETGDSIPLFGAGAVVRSSHARPVRVSPRAGTTGPYTGILSSVRRACQHAVRCRNRPRPAANNTGFGHARALATRRISVARRSPQQHAPLRPADFDTRRYSSILVFQIQEIHRVSPRHHH